MKSWKKPTNELIEKALRSVKKETDRRYFFSQLKNPLWLQPLSERGYFETPPRIRHLPDGSIQFPHWPELEYLKNISLDAPDEALSVILSIPEVDNPRVYNSFLDIALQLPGELSGKLAPKLVSYAQMEHQFLAYRYADLLVHWTEENQTSAALELTNIVVRFLPDPQMKYKWRRRKANSSDWPALLEPSPRFDEWAYKKLLTEGVSALAEKQPYRVARTLIEAVSEMILLRMHQDQLEGNKEEDYSEIWCRRLTGIDLDDKHSSEVLVHSLTYACEKVFEKTPDSIAALEEQLRNQRWKVFDRLRQHLYAMYPTEETKPWIRDLILKHKDYSRWQYHYEFQRMIRSACERFGTEFLTEEERESIFQAILSGPSKALYQDWARDQFREEQFEQYQRGFHRRQFQPFASVLLGKYKPYFLFLESQTNKAVSDEDYSPMGEIVTGAILPRSPRSSEELGKLSDEELLAFINEWDAEYRDADNWFVEITIDALVEAFRSVFKQSVLPNDTRFQFWLDNREFIQRPIYVKAIITEMQDCLGSRNLSRLQESLEFCEWVLSHPDREPHKAAEYEDKIPDIPNWNSSRRAAGDFLGSCISEQLDLPVPAQNQLIKLLVSLCTQYDWRLDESHRVFPEGEDQYAEAINNSRSRALQNLVRLGYGIRLNDSEADASFVMSVLEKRFSVDSNFPLSLPERAVLGVHFVHLIHLDKSWCARKREDVFPRHALPAWQAAFANLIKYSSPYRSVFEILRDDFGFALQHLENLEQSSDFGESLTVVLGQHLVTYYLWGMHSLRGEQSLLESFYQRTGVANHKIWASLFRRVGSSLHNTNECLDSSLMDRLNAFFEWRLESGSETELGKFDHWLNAECLTPEWRLDSYSRALDIAQPEGWDIHGQVEALRKMLSRNPAKVIHCFSKLTDRLKNDAFYISTDTAEYILRTGFESGDETVRENADRARENLLRMGYFDLLSVGD